MKKNIVYGWMVGFALTMPFAVNAKEICSNYTLNEDKISEYVDKLCSKYNTYGTSHKFITTDGNIITVTGGDYGYAIDKEREIHKSRTKEKKDRIFKIGIIPKLFH